MPSSQVPFRNPDVPLEPTPTPSPEPSVWRKYSSHHEFPLSAMTSILLHFALVLVVALLGAIFISLNGGREAPPVEIVSLDGPGGNSLGTDGPDKGGDKDSAFGIQVDKATPEDFSVTSPIVHPEDNVPIPLRSDNTPLGDKHVRSRGNRAGPGSGFSDGSEVGDGNNRRGARRLRMDRWSLQFTYRSGEEYLQKLGNLGAILALAEGGDKFQLIEDLDQRPIKTVARNRDDVNKLNRVYWRQDDADAMHALQKELRLSTPPQYVWAFFPHDLEVALLDAELRKSKLTEAQLNAGGWKTSFTAEKSGGQWLVTVVEQTRSK